jgi:hypothetical protein
MQKPYSRKVTDAGNGCKSLSIPKGLAERFDLDLGDRVPINHDFEDGTLVFHLDDAESE